MNTSKIISSALVALASFSAAAAFAGGSYAMTSDSDYPPAVASGTSGLTRAEVQAELKSASQTRTQTSDSEYPAVLAGNPGQKTRAEVRAELARMPHGNTMLSSDSDYPAQAAGNAATQPGNALVTGAPKADHHDAEPKLIDSTYSGGLEKGPHA